MARYRRLHLAPGVVIAGPLTIKGPGHVYLGEECHVDAASIWTFSPTAVVRIGARTYLMRPEICAVGSVTIGARCEIANTFITDTDFHSTQRSPRGAVRTGPVVIGDDVWLTTATAVLRGVTIGDRAVIGVGVVVAKDVPPDAKVRQAAARITLG